MTLLDTLRLSLKLQGFTQLEDIDICFNLILRGDLNIPLCFLLHEDEQNYIIVSTNPEGREEVKIIPIRNVLYMEIVYDVQGTENNSQKNRQYYIC